MNTHRLRYPPAQLGSAADLPWEQILDAGTTVAVSVAEQRAEQRAAQKRKRRKKPAEEVVEEAPTPLQVQAKGPPWGPILLVGGAVAAALIYASGGKKQ